MEREKIIEEFLGTCGRDMYGIVNLVEKHGFQLIKSGDFKSYPHMTSFYQNGIKNKIIVIPAYLPYDRAIWLLKYMMIAYLMKPEEDIYITITQHYIYNQEINDIIVEIDRAFNNECKRSK